MYCLAQISVILSTYANLCLTKPRVFVLPGNRSMPASFERRLFMLRIVHYNCAGWTSTKNLLPSGSPTFSSSTSSLPVISPLRISANSGNFSATATSLSMNAPVKRCGSRMPSLSQTSPSAPSLPLRIMRAPAKKERPDFRLF